MNVVREFGAFSGGPGGVFAGISRGRGLGAEGVRSPVGSGPSTGGGSGSSGARTRTQAQARVRARRKALTTFGPTREKSAAAPGETGSGAVRPLPPSFFLLYFTEILHNYSFVNICI